MRARAPQHLNSTIHACFAVSAKSHLRQELPSKFGKGARGLAVLAMSLACLGLLAWSAPVQAAEVSLTLSTFVSDGPSPPNVDFLDATFTFGLAAALNELDEIALPVDLTFTVSNDTLVPAEFAMSEMLFNIPDNVTSLSLTGNPANKWQAIFDNSSGGGTSANGFGMFDLQLIDAPGNGIAKIGPGASATFVLALSGTGTVSLNDFAKDEFSMIPPGAPDAQMLVAAKFIQGPNDESAYGAIVPEPSTMALVAIGGLFLMRTRRRKFSSKKS